MEEKEINIKSIARVVYALYVKGVNDAVLSKDITAIKNFLDDNQGISDFCMLYGNKLSYMQFKDTVIYLNTSDTKTKDILDILRQNNSKSGLAYGLTLLAFDYYKLGVKDGGDNNKADKLHILNNKLFYDWVREKQITAEQYIDTMKHTANMMYLDSNHSTALNKLSVFIGKCHYISKIRKINMR